MADTRFDDATKSFNSLTSRRVTLGALLGGALGRLGLGGADAKKSKDGGQRGGGQGAGAEANSVACMPYCGTCPSCQSCTKGKCRTKNGKKRCKKGTCQALSGTPCTPTTGGPATCHDGVCVPEANAPQSSTNCK